MIIKLKFNNPQKLFKTKIVYLKDEKQLMIMIAM